MNKYLSLLLIAGLSLSLSPTVHAQNTKSKKEQTNKSFQRIVTGEVFDAKTKEPLYGASVVQANKRSNGVSVNMKGIFQIRVPIGMVELECSFIGYETKTVNVGNEGKNVSALKIYLMPKPTEVGEVVVTGMQRRKTDSFTGEYVKIKGDELKKINPNNILQALQVFDPSFRILENNDRGSDPNALPEFRMRGDVQLGGNQEINSDEMRMFVQGYASLPNMPLFILDGFPATIQQIIDLQPERIAEVTILKDASATAVYGSRAANGVIVFETKQPLPGKLNFTYSGNYGISMPDLSDYNLMNAAEKLQAEWESGMYAPNSSTQMNIYNNYKRAVLSGVDTYWLSQPLRTAIRQRHSISAQGGDEALRYNVGASHSGNPGVMKGSERNTNSLYLSLGYRYGKVNISNNMSVSNSESQNSPYGSFALYTKLNPYYKLYDQEGNYTSILDEKFTAVGVSRASISNPLYNAQFSSKSGGKSFMFSNNLSVEYAFKNNLRLSGELSLTKSNLTSEAFKSPNHTDFNIYKNQPVERGTYSKSIGENTSWSASLSLNYNLTKGKHVVTSYGRFNISEDKGHNLSLSAKGYPNDRMTNFLFGYKMSERINGNDSRNRRIGLVGQVGYMYDYRYSLDFSMRADRSSSFGANTGFAPFWSVGSRWNLHKENWFKNKWISNLVFRLTYGVTGSQNYSSYQALQMYTYSGLLFPYKSSNAIGAKLLALGNADLGWSKTYNTNLGIDCTMFNGRFNFSYSYYHNYTDNLLIDFTLAPSVGFRSRTQNAGAILNQGHQLNINIVPYQNISKGLRWNLSINGTHNTNVIKKISNALEEQNRKNLENTETVQPLPVYQEGESTTRIFVVKSLGIDPATGKEVFLDRKGNKTFIWNAVDKVPSGNSVPFITGSIHSGFIYKDLSIGFAFMFNLAADRYNTTLVQKLENANLTYNADKRVIASRWSPTNRHARYKSLTRQGWNTQQTSRFLQKTYELVFNSINASYRFDAKKYHFLQNMNISSLNMGMSLSDLGHFMNVQYERGISYPYARTVNINASIIFK